MFPKEHDMHSILRSQFFSNLRSKIVLLSRSVLNVCAWSVLLLATPKLRRVGKGALTLKDFRFNKESLMQHWLWNGVHRCYKIAPHLWIPTRTCHSQPEALLHATLFPTVSSNLLPHRAESHVCQYSPQLGTGSRISRQYVNQAAIC